MQTTAIGTVANSLPENEVILLTLLISKGDILFAELLNIPDNYPKYVVTMDEMASGGNYQGVKQIHLRNFLLAEDKDQI